MKVWPAAVCVISLFLISCDQNRYELGKDASGNTVRLDKRTGEMAIIKGDQIRSLKDAAQADAERKSRLVELEKFKPWASIDTPNIGARASLSTSWRDGKLSYKFDLNSLQAAKAIDKWITAPNEARGDIPNIDDKQTDATLRKALLHRPFILELNDKSGFRLASINVASLTRIVNDAGLAESLEDKGTYAMSEDDYQRIAGWELRWSTAR